MGLRTLNYWWKKARIIMLGLECYKRTAQVLTTDNTVVPIIKFYYQFELFVLRKICLQSKKIVSVVYNFFFLYPPQWIFAPCIYIFFSTVSEKNSPSFLFTLGGSLLEENLNPFLTIFILYIFTSLFLSDFKCTEALEPLLNSFLFPSLHNKTWLHILLLFFSLSIPLSSTA